MMALPGKLTIGFLQEDNPVKAFFRIRPVAILEKDGYQRIEDAAEVYPDDGYIRIVPDKNELTQFKSRMRALGRYCALDLRKYPGENEKIRPNKNYGVGSERNASIVYSDAICEVPWDALAEVLDAQYVFVGEQVTLRADRPGTRYVLVRREGRISGPWVWTDAADVQGCLQLRHAPDCAFLSKPEPEIAQSIMSFTDASGNTVMLMADPGVFGVGACPEAPAAPEAHANPEAPAAPEAPANPEAPAVPEAPEGPSALAAREGTAAPAAPATPEAPAAPAAPAAPEAPTADKPWMQKAEPPHPRAVAGRMSLRDRSLFAQSGMNPRRGRSLSEVVDEQWRRSRYEQLGHPVPVNAMGRPAVSPIERAAQAVREAWQLPEARAGLLDALMSDEEFCQALAERMNLGAVREAGAADRHMEELESERLKLMTEIDALRQKRAEVKAQLMDELLRTQRRQTQAHEEKIAALKAELERNEDAAARAQKAAEAALELLNKTGEQLEQQVLGYLMTGRAIELAMHMNGRSAVPVRHPSLYEPKAGELISDLRVQLESAGFKLDNDDAVSLLASMHTGGMVVVSGPPGSGKSQLVRQLAAALGLAGPARRFAEARSPEAQEIRALLDNCDGLTPLIALLDDINLAGDDAMDGAIRLQEEARSRGLPLCLMLTVQDAPDGRALPARLLSRAFFIRLDPAMPGSSWKPPELKPASPERAVALSAIRDILRPEPELEGEIENRLGRLRQQLERIGYFIDRRTLNELWLYCASVAHAGRMRGMELLDRALATRALPAMLSSMELEQLAQLPQLLCDMPLCVKLMEQPLPLPPL